jgi:hypothetical protein
VTSAPGWEREIHELHDFFEAWMAGREADLTRFSSVLAPGFTMVGPRGAVGDREQTIAQVEVARGRTPSLSIAIEDPVLRDDSGDRVIATYVEVHRFDGGGTARRSTVVFSRDGSAPNGVIWEHVHETFLDGA